MSTPNVPDPQDHGNPDQGGSAPDPRPEPRYGQYGQPSGQQGAAHIPPQPGQDPAQGSRPYGAPESQQGQGPYGQGQYGQSYGYQPAQPSGYSSPGSPQRQGQPKGPAPREVVIGFWLIISAGVLSLINNLVTSFRLPDVLTTSQIDALRDANVDVQDAGGFIVWFSVVMSIIGLGLYVLVAWFILKGHNWARILGTVFAAFSAVGLLVSLPVYVTSVLGWLSLLSSLAGIAGIVMLYLRPSNPYFRRREFNPYRAY
ncbi:hypothetical protein ITX31_08175 [Arthrobacter gandavensis]|uniref:DUF6264 family protein n=1 Tax=Arthrobacter gandavensis TaxID=169960 RepID=UPI00188E6091|nr:DUF6264 family protein [Arthrobacter gandavensis]MBF4994086.1 hypothetical protein [Arthrobacter gandavensis]